MKICKAPQIELFPFELSSKINNTHTYNTSTYCKNKTHRVFMNNHHMKSLHSA